MPIDGAHRAIKRPVMISDPLFFSLLAGGEKVRSLLLNFAPSHIRTVAMLTHGLTSYVFVKFYFICHVLIDFIFNVPLFWTAMISASNCKYHLKHSHQILHGLPILIFIVNLVPLLHPMVILQLFHSKYF